MKLVVLYLDTLAWSERAISYFYEDINDIKNAILHRERSLTTAEYVIKMKPKREYEEYRYRSLCKLGSLYEKAHRYTDSVRVCEEALSLVKLGFTDRQEELLERLVRVCGITGKTNKESMYQRLLKDKKGDDVSFKRACSEVVAVLKYSDDELVKQIPDDFITFLKENSATDYVAAIDPKEKLANQISDEAKAFIAIIRNGYWDFGKEDATDKYNSNEEGYRIDRWSLLKEKMNELTEHLVIVNQIVEEGDENIFCEVYNLLESLPTELILSIPIEKLMWVKENRGMVSTMNVEVSINDIPIETLALLKYVLGDLVYLN